MSKEGTPDLSRIVSVIMEHPELIEQISRLAESDTENTEGSQTPIEDDFTTTEKEEKEVSEPTFARGDIQDTRRRNQLLFAMKPYLSERRARAIDTVLTFGEIFDTLKSGKAR